MTSSEADVEGDIFINDDGSCCYVATQNSWEKWYVRKEAEYRDQQRHQCEEFKVKKDAADKNVREQIEKRQVDEKKLNEWLDTKAKQAGMEKQRQTEEIDKLAEQRALELKTKKQKSDERYQVWLQKKQLEENEQRMREKVRMEEKMRWESDKRQNADAAFERWQKDSMAKPTFNNNHAYVYADGQLIDLKASTSVHSL